MQKYKHRLRNLPYPFLALAALLCAQTNGLAQSILGSAEAYTLLGGSAITSSGAAGTVLANGNVGLSSAAADAIIGFPPATINNGEILATSALTAQAGSDLLRAAAGLAGLSADTDLSGIDLGGLTLVPGVYRFSSSAALTGQLTLDAQGRDHAYWVFQIGTNFTTAANSGVSVIHFSSAGGQDLGLFWNAQAEITSGANNQLAGNYLSGTSITFGTGSAGSGRGLAVAATTLDANQLDARGGPAGGDWTGGLAYDGNGALTAIPEPAAILWLTPLMALGVALLRRRTNHQSAA